MTREQFIELCSEPSNWEGVTNPSALSNKWFLIVNYRIGLKILPFPTGFYVKRINESDWNYSFDHNNNSDFIKFHNDKVVEIAKIIASNTSSEIIDMIYLFSERLVDQFFEEETENKIPADLQRFVDLILGI